MTNKFYEAGKTPNQSDNDRTYSMPSEEMDIAELSDEQLAELREESIREDWLQLSRDAFNSSDEYFDSSIRPDIERNMAHFGSRHAPGSKYYSESYKHRNKTFRPKTRSVIRRNEAKAAIALFSTQDAVSIEPENDSMIEYRVSAEVNQELINYRLDNTIPWFKVAMGAYQDTMTTGVCVSHQYWDYQEIQEEEALTDELGNPVIDNETGEPATGIRRYVVKDTPKIDLRPIENFRFSPSADWDDPINTSSYLIDIVPMEIGDIKMLAKSVGKSKIPWHDLDDMQLRAGGTVDGYDPIRSQRENQRQDSQDQGHLNGDFDVVFIHRNIIRQEGVDWLYYTLGTHYLLSDPIPLLDEYPHLKPGERPYVMGVSILESHKNYPESVAGLSASLQQAANDIANQRADNVTQVLNRRYFANRNANIDYRSLVRSVPGAIVEMDDINRDIRSEVTPDVTSSAYAEQDRLNMDFDELTGSFSTSSVASNRSLNETVGGMEMLSADADDVTEYQLRTFVESWVKPVLKQVVQLEQRFETDAALLQLVGEKAKMWQQYGINQITDMMLQGNMTVAINVGFGAISPTKRIEKLAMGLNTVLNFAPDMAARLDGDEIATEIFGTLGYSSSTRFFPEMEQEQTAEEPLDPRIAVAQINAQMKELEMMHQSQEKDKDRQMQLMTSDLNARIAAMKAQGASQDNVQKIKSDFAKLLMTIKASERMAGMKASQMSKPQFEPPGKAEKGLSYLQ